MRAAPAASQPPSLDGRRARPPAPGDNRPVPHDRSRPSADPYAGRAPPARSNRQSISRTALLSPGFVAFLIRLTRARARAVSRYASSWLTPAAITRLLPSGAEKRSARASAVAKRLPSMATPDDYRRPCIDENPRKVGPFRPSATRSNRAWTDSIPVSATT